jgi:hypothetical protein
VALSVLALLLFCETAVGQQDTSYLPVSGPPSGSNLPLPSRTPPAVHASGWWIRSGEVKELPDHHHTRLATAIAFNWAATTADVVTTLKGLDSGRCAEGNPLFGSHPSPARVAVISYAYTGGYTFFSLLHHRKHPEAKAPWIGNLILGAGHAVVAGANARCF